MNTVETNNIFCIIGRKEAEEAILKTDKFDNVVFISIVDPKTKEIEDFNKFDDVIKLKFWDVEEEIGRYCPIHNIQAKQIKDFIIKNKDKKFFINCEAGVSRSAGVGCAIEFLLRDTYLFPKEEHVPSKVRQHQRYMPNEYVYKAIINA